MNITIWKHQLEITDVQKISIPQDAEILTVAMQGDNLCIWFRCDTIKPTEDRLIAIVGTGNHAPSIDDARYISSFQMYGGALVFHVFEKVSK